MAAPKNSSDQNRIEKEKNRLEKQQQAQQKNLEKLKKKEEQLKTQLEKKQDKSQKLNDKVGKRLSEPLANISIAEEKKLQKSASENTETKNINNDVVSIAQNFQIKSPQGFDITRYFKEFEKGKAGEGTHEYMVQKISNLEQLHDSLTKHMEQEKHTDKNSPQYAEWQKEFKKLSDNFTEANKFSEEMYKTEYKGKTDYTQPELEAMFNNPNQSEKIGEYLRAVVENKLEKYNDPKFLEQVNLLSKENQEATTTTLQQDQIPTSKITRPRSVEKMLPKGMEEQYTQPQRADLKALADSPIEKAQKIIASKKVPAPSQETEINKNFQSETISSTYKDLNKATNALFNHIQKQPNQNPDELKQWNDNLEKHKSNMVKMLANAGKPVEQINNIQEPKTEKLQEQLEQYPNEAQRLNKLIQNAEYILNADIKEVQAMKLPEQQNDNTLESKKTAEAAPPVPLKPQGPQSAKVAPPKPQEPQAAKVAPPVPPKPQGLRAKLESTQTVQTQDVSTKIENTDQQQKQATKQVGAKNSNQNNKQSKGVKNSNQPQQNSQKMSSTPPKKPKGILRWLSGRNKLIAAVAIIALCTLAAGGIGLIAGAMVVGAVAATAITINIARKNSYENKMHKFNQQMSNQEVQTSSNDKSAKKEVDKVATKQMKEVKKNLAIVRKDFRKQILILNNMNKLNSEKTKDPLPPKLQENKMIRKIAEKYDTTLKRADINQLRAIMQDIQVERKNIASKIATANKDLKSLTVAEKVSIVEDATIKTTKRPVRYSTIENQANTKSVKTSQNNVENNKQHTRAISAPEVPSQGPRTPSSGRKF